MTELGGVRAENGPGQAEPRAMCPLLEQVVQTQPRQVCSWWAGVRKIGEGVQVISAGEVWEDLSE